MGAVVTMPARSVPVGVSKFLVIDGQQRLTTVALLLCAIRDSLTAGEEPAKRRIQNHYLTNDGYDGLDFFKLLPTEGDRATYSLLVNNVSTASPDTQIDKAYGFFRRRLKDQDDEGNALDAKRVLEILETRLMAVMINLSDTDDPYLIFERHAGSLWNVTRNYATTPSGNRFVGLRLRNGNVQTGVSRCLE